MSRTIIPHSGLRQANRTRYGCLLRFSTVQRKGNSESGHISIEKIVSYTSWVSIAVLLPCQDGRSVLSLMGRYNHIHLRPHNFGRFYDLSLSLPPSDSLLEPTSPRCLRHARLEQHHLDGSNRLLPTTANSTISFEEHCVIRLLEQVNMASIQRGNHKSHTSLQLYETRAPGRIFEPPTYHITRVAWYSCIHVVFCRMTGSAHRTTGKAVIQECAKLRWIGCHQRIPITTHPSFFYQDLWVIQ